MTRLLKAGWTQALMLSLLLLTGCRQQREEMAEENAVYYWRTDLRLDTTERAFLKQYDIRKVYCRYFDVVMSDDGQPMPNATIHFESPHQLLPEGEAISQTIFEADSLPLGGRCRRRLRR